MINYLKISISITVLMIVLLIAQIAIVCLKKKNYLSYSEAKDTYLKYIVEVIEGNIACINLKKYVGKSSIFHLNNNEYDLLLLNDDFVRDYNLDRNIVDACLIIMLPYIKCEILQSFITKTVKFLSFVNFSIIVGIVLLIKRL